MPINNVKRKKMELNAFKIALSIICMFADDFLLLRGSPKKGGRCIFTL